MPFSYDQYEYVEDVEAGLLPGRQRAEMNAHARVSRVSSYGQVGVAEFQVRMVPRLFEYLRSIYHPYSNFLVVVIVHELVEVAALVVSPLVSVICTDT